MKKSTILFSSNLTQRFSLKFKVAFVGLLAFFMLSLNSARAQGNALNFDGVNDYVDCGNATNVKITQGTIEAWIRTSGAGAGYRGIVAKNNAYGLYLKDNVLVAYSYGTSTEHSTGRNLADGKWHHVAMSFNNNVGNGSVMYVDGVSVLTFTFTNSDQTRGLSIGASLASNAGAVSQFFTGSIDEVRVWNTIRTASQLQASMYGSVAANSSGLIAYYDFNTGTAGSDNTAITTVADKTSNANTGTLNGLLLNNSTSNFVESYAMVVPVATTATGITSTGFTANWTAPVTGTVDNYLLDVSTASDFSNAISGSPFTISSPITSKILTGLSGGKYYYRVRADKATVTSQGGYNSGIAAFTLPGNALNFDGADDYVSVPHNAAFNVTKVTIEGWVNWNPQFLNSVNFIFSKGYERLDIHTGGGSGNNGLRFIPTAGVYIDVANALPVGKWTHIACVYDPANTYAKIYINGLEKAYTVTGSLSTAFINNTNNITIGRRGDNTNSFKGSIDELLVWNVVRTQAEIQNDMLNSIAAGTSGLIANYNFDNGVSCATNTGVTTLSDFSGNTLNGTLNNFSLTTGCSSNWVESYAMAIPNATTATNVTSSSFTANWTAPAVGIVNNYLLDVSTTSDFSGTITGSPFTIPFGTNSKTITGLSGGTYYYRVRADKTSVTGQGGISNTITQAIAYTPPGNALYFDGLNDYIDATIPYTYVNSFTMEAWINPASFAGGNKGVFGYGLDNGAAANGINVTIDASGVLYYNHPGVASYNTGYTFKSTNKWYHLAVTRSGGVSKTYVDGVLVFSTTASNPATPTQFNLGSHTQFRFFSGKIDEFRFYNTALTQSQIQSDAYSTSVSVPASLVLYYNFDNGVASGNNAGLSTISDQSGNGYNGTLNNFALSGSSSNWVESYAMVVPTATSATSVTNSGFTANWTAPATGKIDSYLLDVSTMSDFSGPISGSPFTIASPTTSKTLTGLSGGTYYYRVRADKTSVTGQGGSSNTITQSIAYTQPANAINFDGNNDYVSVPHNTAFNMSKVTIESWVYWNPFSVAEIQSIFSKGFERLDIHTGGGSGNNGLRFIPTAGVYLDVANALPVGVWTHIACVYDPANTYGKVYINGVERAYTLTGSLSTALINNTNNINIGRRVDNTYPFKGSLDELHVWNVVRSQSQIQADMMSTITTATTGLIANYNFDNGVSCATNTGVTTLADISGNSFNGTLNNFTLATGCSSNWIESYAMVVPTPTAATNYITGGFTANWTAPAVGIADNYLLDVSTNASFSSFVGGYNGMSVTGTSQAITGLAQGTTYYYRVRANKTSVTGQGMYSSIMSATTCVNSSSTNNMSICSTALPYSWNGLTFNAAGTQTAYLINAAGCDSAATLNLTVKATSTSTTNISICPSALPYTWNGLTFNTAGTQTAYLTNAAGCDSAATLNLTVKSTSNSATSASICSSELPYNWNGNKTAAGTYTYTTTNSKGCDSVAVLNLTIKSNYAITASAGANGTISNSGVSSICEGNNSLTYIISASSGYSIASVLIDGVNQGAITSYTFINVTSNHTISANFVSNCIATSSITTATVCSSALPYIWNGNSYTTAGTYTIHLINAGGCDSTTVLNLSITQNTSAGQILSNTNGYVTSLPICNLNSTVSVYPQIKGGSWSSKNPSIATGIKETGATSSGYIKSVSEGTTTIVYTLSNLINGCNPVSQITVIVAPLPALNVITGNSTPCLGTNTTFSNNTSGGVWTATRGTITGGGVFTSNSAGDATISYKVTNAAGCSAVVTKSISINPLPGLPSISFATGTNGITGNNGYCTNRTITLVGNPANGSWSKTGVISISTSGTPSTNNVVSTGSTPGAASITYTITDNKGCSNSRTINANIVACSPRGVASQATINNEQLVIYPNPAKTIINIKADKLIGTGTIVITDLYGKQLKQQPLSLGANTIDVSHYAKGIYMVTIITEQGKQTEKVVVE